MRLLALTIALFLPMQAVALSCVAPSVVRSYQNVADAADQYVVVHGRLTFNPKKLPKSNLSRKNTPVPTSLDALLIGKSLGQAGFVTPFDNDISLIVKCFGPWCGSVATGQDVLAFVRKGSTGYALTIDPCGGSVFATPKRSLLRQVKDCYRNGGCVAAEDN